jgi:hypothetical protein
VSSARRVLSLCAIAARDASRCDVVVIIIMPSDLARGMLHAACCVLSLCGARLHVQRCCLLHGCMFSAVVCCMLHVQLVCDCDTPLKALVISMFVLQVVGVVLSVSPVPSADVAAASPVPAQMWQR